MELSPTDEPKDQNHNFSGFSDTMLPKRKREAISAPLENSRSRQGEQHVLPASCPPQEHVHLFNGPSREFRLQGGVISLCSRW